MDGFLEQARDALHFELYGGGGDAPLVFAAHGCYLSHGGMRMAMVLETHYCCGSGLGVLCCYCGLLRTQ
jgi:hypothetical protein